MWISRFIPRLTGNLMSYYTRCNSVAAKVVHTNKLKQKATEFDRSLTSSQRPALRLLELSSNRLHGEAYLIDVHPQRQYGHPFQDQDTKHAQLHTIITHRNTDQKAILTRKEGTSTQPAQELEDFFLLNSVNWVFKPSWVPYLLLNMMKWCTGSCLKQLTFLKLNLQVEFWAQNPTTRARNHAPIRGRANNESDLIVVVQILWTATKELQFSFLRILVLNKMTTVLGFRI